jgi:hypothetical protein
MDETCSSPAETSATVPKRVKNVCHIRSFVKARDVLCKPCFQKVTRGKVAGDRDPNVEEKDQILDERRKIRFANLIHGSNCAICSSPRDKKAKGQEPSAHSVPKLLVNWRNGWIDEWMDGWMDGERLIREKRLHPPKM